MEALEAVQRSRFNVVLMDCRMPVMDGYEAARQIRRLSGPAHRVPIIALTASAFKEDRLRAEEAGMDDFIAKPFHDAELVQKCLSWVQVTLHDSSDESGAEQPVPLPAASNHDRFKRYSAEFVQSIMEIFLESAPPVFNTLAGSLQKGDWAEAKTSAHWLRGGASRLIAPDLQEQLGQIESACAAESPRVSRAEIESLTNSFRDACRVAEKWLAENRIYCTTS
jgi:CheY-like chemotaxis protein